MRSRVIGPPALAPYCFCDIGSFVPDSAFTALLRLMSNFPQASPGMSVDSFSEALLQERKHQAMIQAWYEESIGLDTSATQPVSSGPGVPAPGDPGMPRPGSTS